MDTNDKNTIDEDDDDDEDEPKSISSSSRLPSRLGSFTFFASSGSSSSDGFTSIMVPLNANSLVMSRRQFSRPIESLSVREIKDGQEDTSIPTPLPPHPISRMASYEGQGQQQTKMTADEMKMQIEVLQTELEQMRNENKRLTSVLKDGVPHLLNDNESYQSMENDLTCKSEISEEFKAVSKNHGENTTKNEINKTLQPNETNEVQVKSDNPEIPISKLFKKHSYNKTEFNQEDFLNSLLSSPPLGAREHGKGFNVSQDMKFEGLQISNRNHQGPKQFSDEAINNLRSESPWKENVDSDNEIMEDGVFENNFHEDITEVTLPSNPNIPHTRSLKTPGYEYERQDSWGATKSVKTDRKLDRDAASPSGSNSPAVVPSGDSANPLNLSLLKYPDPSPTTGVHHATQLPPKRKSQELPVDGSPNPVSEYDEDDIGYQEYSQSNRNAYSKVSGSSHYYSSSRYTSYMASLQSLADHNGYLIKDVTPDGNCMFSAIIDQLRIQGNFDLTPNSLRRTAVDYLRKNPENQDGTHLESFLSTETWEEYLKRMGQESQWGDHMVLQACTEVTGQRIVVFKPNTNKTELVPTAQEVMVDYTITLGHIGESHFVSLRPTDWEATWPLKAHAHRARMKEKKKLARKKKLERQKSKEGKDQSKDVPEKDESTAADEKETAVTEEIEGATGETIKEKKQMEDEDDSGDEEEENNSQFKTTDDIEDLVSHRSAIDSLSLIPMAHLSYLMNTIIERRYLITFSAENAVYQYDQLSREDNDSNYKIFHFGSVVEEMVTNILGCGQKQPVFPQIPKLINYIVKRQPVSFGSNADNVSGDTVYLTDSTETRPGYVRLKFRLREVDNLPEHLRSQISKYYLHPESSKKAFLGIRCSIWPNEAREWFERDRPVEWPGDHILKQSKEDDCFLLSRHHPQSGFPESEWQWIFPITERRLALEALSEDQKYCFRVFKLLVDFHTRNLLVKLSTTHLKTIMYTTCEIIACDLWKLNPGGCLLFLLHRLITCLRMGVISNYFIAANNMIDHFTTKQLCALRQRLYAVRVFPIPALIMLVDSHNLFGTCLLDRTLADIKKFRQHRDLYRSFFECFLVNFSLCYRVHVLSMYFENAKQILEEAFFVKTEKLPTNQGEELDFEQFFLDVTGDEFGDLKGLVVYEIDMVCNSSFSHSLCNSTDFVALKDILDPTDCMDYSEVPVPRDVHDSRYKELMFLETLTSHLTHQRQYQKAAHFVRCAIKKSMEAIQCSNEEREELQTASNHARLFQTQMTLYNCVLLRLYNDLYNIYKSMGQTELMQEYIADYEAVCLASDYTYHYNRVAKIWQKLGNNARAQELRDQAESIKSSKTYYSSNVSPYSSIDDVD